MAKHNELGKWGEELAAQYLRSKGWYIRHRDWRDKHRDLDIVAVSEDFSLIIVVEVKTRSTDHWGEPELAIDLEKQNNIIKACTAYRRAYHLEAVALRYDTISIVGSPDMPIENVRIEHKENTFDVTARYFYNEQRRKRSYYKHRPGQW